MHFQELKQNKCMEAQIVFSYLMGIHFLLDIEISIYAL